MYDMRGITCDEPVFSEGWRTETREMLKSEQTSWIIVKESRLVVCRFQSRRKLGLSW